MPRERYQDRLDDLRDDVLDMSELVADSLRRGLDALKRKDTGLAREVIEGDDEINRMYLTLESECVDLFALQQPVASDLRFVTASFKILTDLERIGDLATNLAGYVIKAGNDVFPDIDVQRIGGRTLAMLDDVMEVYRTADAEWCRAIAEQDDEVDEMCEVAIDAVARSLIAHKDLPEAEVKTMMPEVRRLLLTIRDLERVGDHAVNIAARTLYMVENDDGLLR